MPSLAGKLSEHLNVRLVIRPTVVAVTRQPIMRGHEVTCVIVLTIVDQVAITMRILAVTIINCHQKILHRVFHVHLHEPR